MFRELYSGIRSLRSIAPAVNAIDALSIRKHLASTCGHRFMQCSSTVAIVTGTLFTSRLSSSTWQTQFTTSAPNLRSRSSDSPLGYASSANESLETRRLEQHRLSVIHKSLSNIKCIADRRCKKQFTSSSARLHHLESEACPSKMTRDKLHSAVQSSDVNRLITEGSIQEYTALMGPAVSGTTSITESVIFTPITDESFGGFRSPPDTWELQSGMLTPNSGSSQPLLKDSSLAMRLTCPLCPVGRKPFKSLEALRNHLSSPAHSPKVFHCPLYFAGLEHDRKVSQLMRYFSTLSGLMQHLESGACQGRATFRKTVEYIEHNLGKTGLRKLRLLN